MAAPDADPKLKADEEVDAVEEDDEHEEIDQNSGQAAANGAPDSAAAKKKKNKKKKNKKKAAGSDPAAAAIAAPGVGVSQQELDIFRAMGMHKYLATLEFPVALELNAKRGRHIRATRDISQGEQLLVEEPYAAVVVDDQLEYRCSQCFTRAPSLYICGTCMHARYCSTTCKNNAAVLHSLECETLSKLSELKIDGESAPVRLLIRIMYLHYKEQHEDDDVDPNSVKAKLKQKLKALQTTNKKHCTYEDVADLLSHEEDVPRETKAQFVLALLNLPSIMDEKAMLPMDVAIAILLRLQVNGIYIDENRQRLALAMFPAVAYLNHSCNPNCCHSFDPKGNCSVRALRSISKNQEACQSYIDMYQIKPARHVCLQASYYFDRCDCSRCCTPLSQSADRFIGGYSCATCSSVMRIWEAGEEPWGKPDEIVSCSGAECKTQQKMHFLLQMEADCDAAFQQAHELVRQATDEGFATARQVLEDNVLNSSAGKWLHPYHVKKFNSYLLLAGIGRHVKDYMSQAKYCRLAIDALRNCFDTEHAELAAAYFGLGEALQGAADAQTLSKDASTVEREARRMLYAEAMEAYQNSARIRNVCYGDKHNATKQAAKKASELARRAQPATEESNAKSRKK